MYFVVDNLWSLNRLTMLHAIMFLIIILYFAKNISVKITLLTALLIISVVCLAQKDDCNKITQKINEAGMTVIKSPELKRATVIMQTGYGIRPFFALHIHLNNETEYSQADVATVQFEDGTTLLQNIKVSCQQELTVVSSDYGSSSTASHSGNYLVQGFFEINKENIDKFKTRLIKRVSLSNSVENVATKEAKKIITYIKCISGTMPQ